jgi:hypothetical protein
MSEHLTHVHLRLAGVTRGTLQLRRIPKYLRFTWKNSDWKTLDALDQLDDTPHEDEQLMVAVLGERGNVHIDGVRNGRRYGEWRETADYHLLAEQPPQEVLRNSEKWRGWCYAQEAKRKETSHG